MGNLNVPSAARPTGWPRIAMAFDRAGAGSFGRRAGLTWNHRLLVVASATKHSAGVPIMAIEIGAPEWTSIFEKFVAIMTLRWVALWHSDRNTSLCWRLRHRAEKYSCK